MQAKDLAWATAAVYWVLYDTVIGFYAIFNLLCVPALFLFPAGFSYEQESRRRLAKCLEFFQLWRKRGELKCIDSTWMKFNSGVFVVWSLGVAELQKTVGTVSICYTVLSYLTCRSSSSSGSLPSSQVQMSDVATPLVVGLLLSASCGAWLVKWRSAVRKVVGSTPPLAAT